MHWLVTPGHTAGARRTGEDRTLSLVRSTRKKETKEEAGEQKKKK